jgi:hypothetical protein
MYSVTTQALRDYDNQHEFERMCADILNTLGYRHVTLQAPRGGSDEGKDITFISGQNGNEKGLACCTLRKDIEKKFNEDFSQRQMGEFQFYILFCTTYLTHSQKVKFGKYCLDNIDAELIIYDGEALRSLLDTVIRQVRQDHLHITDESQPTADIQQRIVTAHVARLAVVCGSG